MTMQWMRYVRVRFPQATRLSGVTGGLTINRFPPPRPQLRVDFDVKRENGAPPEGEVMIYNMGNENAAQIVKGANVSLEAGYVSEEFQPSVPEPVGQHLSNIAVLEQPAQFATIFGGVVTHASEEWGGLSRITRVTIGGHTSSINPDDDPMRGITNRSYPELTSIRVIAQDIVEQDMRLTVGSLESIDIGLVAAFYYVGDSSDALTALLEPKRITWFEDDDGVVQFNRRGRIPPGAPIIVLQSTPSRDIRNTSSLIGTPARTDEGAKASSLLIPNIALNNLVDMRARSLQGSWKVVGYKHRGSNYEGRFQTDLELREPE